MTTSIAQSRQQLSALITAAQQQPQIITNRNTPVAVLVSTDYFRRTQTVAAPSPQPVAPRFYDTLLQLRATLMPEDDEGLPIPPSTAASGTRQTAWQRPNAFTD